MGIFRFLRNIFALPGNIAAMAQTARRGDEVLHMLHTLHGETHALRMQQRELLEEQDNKMHGYAQQMDQYWKEVQEHMSGQTEMLRTLTGHLSSLVQSNAASLHMLGELKGHAFSMPHHIEAMHTTLSGLAEHLQHLQKLGTLEDRTTTIANTLSSIQEQAKMLQTLQQLLEPLHRLGALEDRSNDIVHYARNTERLLGTINDRSSDQVINTAATVDMLKAMEVQTSDMTNSLRDIRQGAFHMALEKRREELLALPRYQDAKRLNRFEKQIYSQNGEDGIIAEIFRRIGTTDMQFVECGVSDGLECNTAHLLQKGWRGLWVEVNPAFCSAIRRSFATEIAAGTLQVADRFLTAENAERILREFGAPEQFDLLSIDIDGNDYWLWNALETFRPRVVVIEYNAQFPPEMPWVLGYDPAFRWDGTQYYGASLAAMTALAERKGYVLVGCEITGNNAFFVRVEYAEHFRDPFTPVNHYEPPRHYLVHHVGHRRGFGPGSTAR